MSGYIAKDGSDIEKTSPIILFCGVRFLIRFAHNRLTVAVHLVATLFRFTHKDSSQGLAKLHIFASHLLPDLVCFGIINSQNMTPVLNAKKQHIGAVFLHALSHLPGLASNSSSLRSQELPARGFLVHDIMNSHSHRKPFNPGRCLPRHFIPREPSPRIELGTSSFAFTPFSEKCIWGLDCILCVSFLN